MYVFVLQHYSICSILHTFWELYNGMTSIITFCFPFSHQMSEAVMRKRILRRLNNKQKNVLSLNNGVFVVINSTRLMLLTLFNNNKAYQKWKQSSFVNSFSYFPVLFAFPSFSDSPFFPLLHLAISLRSLHPSLPSILVYSPITGFTEDHRGKG